MANLLILGRRFIIGFFICICVKCTFVEGHSTQDEPAMVQAARIKRSPLTTLETTKGGTVVETLLSETTTVYSTHTDNDTL